MASRPDSRLEAWLAAACADAERRGLGELKPLLESMAKSSGALRDADAQLDAIDRAEAEAEIHDAAGTAIPSKTDES
jgi:hypothetical protein